MTASRSLSPRASRAFVIAFVAVLFALAALATVLITRGWDDPDMQRRVEQMEAERRAGG